MPIQVQNVGRSSRKLRSPVHTFQISHLPYHIVPFFVAAVLPGETMKNLMIQSRAVTDPIKNPLIGWWLEHYFFYCKHSDLYEREELRQMVLNPAWSKTNVTTSQGGTGTNTAMYHAAGTDMINWVELCYRRIVDEYFRDEDETYLDHRFADLAAGGRSYSLAKMVGDSVFDSVSIKDDETAQDVTLIDAATTDTLLASEVATGMRLWEQQRMYGITELSYEDWLRTFGVSAPAEDSHKPELVRYLREWQYPSNTIDPTNGTPRSAVSWSIRDRADKNRSFKEPGFIIGLTVCRPKVYIRQQEGSFTALLNDWKAWMPAVFRGDPHLSRKEVPTDRGPLATVVTDADGYIVDLADLFLYGEQFTNLGLTETDRNFMDSVNASLTNTIYPLDRTDINELFVNAEPACRIRQDGVVNLHIAMNAMNPVMDLSPRGGNRSQETSGGGF